jgi:folate-binding protein YgfZ
VTDAMDPSAAEDGVLLVRTADQVVEVTGTDRLAHLDATTTQALKDARPGTVTAALVLDANGNPLAMFDVLVLPDRVWLVTPGQDVTDVVMALIAGRTFLADARFTVLDHGVVRVHPGPDVPTGVTDLTRRAWSGMAVTPEPATVRSTPSGDVAVAVDRAGSLTIAGPSAEVDALAVRLLDVGAREADPARLEGWRVVAGRPAWAHEVTPPHLPEELGLLPTHVHLAKGCYPGQEAVARMWMLGRPRRRLARVHIVGVGPDDVVPGWRIGEGRDMVEVTARGRGRGTDGLSALAFVPGTASVGDRIGPEDGPTVEVVALVGDDPVPPGHDPAMRRRRDRTERTPQTSAPRRPPAPPAERS